MVATMLRPKTQSRNTLMGRRPKEADLSTYRGRFAARLRELRQKKYATQSDFVDALRIQGIETKEVTVSTWERGYSAPDIDLLPVIAITLGVAVRTLMPTE